MRANLNITILGFILIYLPCSTIAGEQSSAEPGASILEIMTSIIVPASDTLWGVDDPKSDAEWKQLDNAAQALITSAAAIKLGGFGPRDSDRVAQTEWQNLAGTMSDAAEQALKAIQNRDLDALFEAGDALYPPCESCHLLFNPALNSQ